MARYLNVPQQNLVNMYTPLNVGFYSGILDKAQQNLNEATKIQSAYEDEIYNIKAFDQATKDAYINKAKQIIGNELDKEFVSSSNMARAVTRASKELAPWKNLNERQLELAKQYDEDKRRLGANFLGTDPRQTNLRDADGNLISPTQLNYVGINAEDLDKVFNLSEKGVLTSKYDRRVKSDIPYKIKFETVEGMSPKEIAQRYGLEGSEVGRLTEAQLQAVPQVMDIFNGDKKKAIEYLQNRNFANAGQYGQSVTSHYVDDDWGLWLAKKAASTPPPTGGGDLFVATDDDVINPNIDTSIKTIVSNILGAPSKVDWDNLQFDKNGQISKTTTLKGNDITSPMQAEYGIVGSKTPDVTVQNKNYLQEKLEIELLRLKLIKGASNGAELMLYKNMTPQQLVQKTREASNNTARYYGTRGLTVSDNLAMNVASPFIDGNGNFKDNTNAGLQYKDKKTGKWTDATPDMLIDKFNLSDPESKTNLHKELSNVSTNVISFNDPKSVKLVGSINVKGETLPIRYNPANVEIREMFEPQRQVQQILLTPGPHRISFNGVNYELNTTLDLNAPKPSYKTIVTNAIVDNRLSKTPRKGQKISDYDAATLEANDIINSYNSGEALLGNTNKYAMGYAINNNIVYRTENPKKAIPTQYIDEE